MSWPVGTMVRALDVPGAILRPGTIGTIVGALEWRYSRCVLTGAVRGAQLYDVHFPEHPSSHPTRRWHCAPHTIEPIHPPEADVSVLDRAPAQLGLEVA